MTTVVHLTVTVRHSNYMSSKTIAENIKAMLEISPEEDGTFIDLTGVSESIVNRIAYSEEKPN